MKKLVILVIVLVFGGAAGYLLAKDEVRVVTEKSAYAVTDEIKFNVKNLKLAKVEFEPCFAGIDFQKKDSEGNWVDLDVIQPTCPEESAENTAEAATSSDSSETSDSTDSDTDTSDTETSDEADDGAKKLLTLYPFMSADFSFQIETGSTGEGTLIRQRVETAVKAATAGTYRVYFNYTTNGTDFVQTYSDPFEVN